MRITEKRFKKSLDKRKRNSILEKKRKGYTMNKRLNEKVFVDNDMRKKAVAEVLNIPKEDMFDVLKISSYDDKMVEYGSQEYLVFTEDQAEKRALEYTEDLLRTMGLEELGVAIDYYEVFDMEELKKWILDDFYEQADELAEEEDNYENKYENIFIQELVEFGVLSDNDLIENTEGLLVLNTRKDAYDYFDDYAEARLRDLGSDYDIGNYIVDSFSFDFYKEFIDIPKAAKWLFNTYSTPANELAGYDGKEEEVNIDGIVLFIYRVS